MEQIKLKVLIAERLYKLPKKMNTFRSSNALAECILWELSHEMCLHLKYAAYFMYNPDFYLCKGVAGIKREEVSHWGEYEPWCNIEDFEKTIKESQFNKNVRNIMMSTHYDDTPHDVAQKLHNSIQGEQPQSVIWNLKNDNLGILLYEAREEADAEEVENAVEYLSFC